MITAKLHRARRHINETRFLIDKYFSNNPIRFFVEEEFRHGELWNVIKVSEIDDADPSIQCSLGDSLFNLRSFLDHLYCRIAKKYCCPNNIDVDWMSFPIKKEKSRFEHWVHHDRHAKQISTDILEIIENVQPYHEAGSPIGKLHDLNNIDKHRSLVLAATHYDSINMFSLFDMETISEIESTSVGGEPIHKMFEKMVSNIWVKDIHWNKKVTVGHGITAYRADKTPNTPQVKFGFSILEEGFEIIHVNDFLKEVENSVTEVYQSLREFLD